MLPSLTLAAFLTPHLIRVVAARVGGDHGGGLHTHRLGQRAGGAALVVRHALPNALLATMALVGTQFAHLISGAPITDIIFGWPGLGRLLVESVRQLDFPVVQAAVFVIALLVFVVNTTLDLVFRLVDPRLRTAR